MKLILHIGGGKCGSSAIQEHLRVNAAALRAQGVLVSSDDLTPDGSQSGTQVPFMEMLRSKPFSQSALDEPLRPDAAGILLPRLSALRERMQRDGLHTLVVSAEDLINVHGFSHLFAQARTLFDIHVVAYIRRQDEYLASAWGQWHVKRYASLDAYTADNLQRPYDWGEMLRAWRDDFGADHLRVRLFERGFLHDGDAAEDFLKITGLPFDATHRKVGRVNESNDDRLISLAHRVRDVFPSEHDTTFFQVLNAALGNLPKPPKEKPFLFDFTRRTALMAAHADANERVRSTYFAELPAPLFPPPRAEDTQDLSELEKLDLDVSTLTRVVYALAVQSVKAASAQRVSSPETTRTLAQVALPDSQVLRAALHSPWYAERNPDVIKAGVDLVAHWRTYGVQEGRLPAPDIAVLTLELLKERNEKLAAGTAPRS